MVITNEVAQQEVLELDIIQMLNIKLLVQSEIY